MIGSWAARLPRLGRWPRLALVGCCLLLALDSAATGRAASRAARPPAVHVVVAARPLPTGWRVRARDVRSGSLPTTAAVAADVRRRGDVVGRRLSSPIAAGEAFSAIRLLGRDLTAGLAPGTVAVPVRVTDPRVGDLVHAGDRVSLYAVAPLADVSDGSIGAPQASTPRQAAGPTVLASRLLVLVVLAGSDPSGSDAASPEVVVATSPSVALRLTRAAATSTLAAVAEPP